MMSAMGSPELRQAASRAARRPDGLRHRMRHVVAMAFAADRHVADFGTNLVPLSTADSVPAVSEQEAAAYPPRGGYEWGSSGLLAVVVHDVPGEGKDDGRPVTRVTAWRVRPSETGNITIGKDDNVLVKVLYRLDRWDLDRDEGLLRLAVRLDQRRSELADLDHRIGKLHFQRRAGSVPDFDQRLGAFRAKERDLLAAPEFPSILVAFDDTVGMEAVTQTPQFRARVVESARAGGLIDRTSYSLMLASSRGRPEALWELFAQAVDAESLRELTNQQLDELVYPYGGLYYVPRAFAPDLQGKPHYRFLDLRGSVTEDGQPRAFCWRGQPDDMAGSLQLHAPGLSVDFGDIPERKVYVRTAERPPLVPQAS